MIYDYVVACKIYHCHLIANTSPVPGEKWNDWSNWTSWTLETTPKYTSSQNLNPSEDIATTPSNEWSGQRWTSTSPNHMASGWASEAKDASNYDCDTKEESTSQNYWSGWGSEAKDTSNVASNTQEESTPQSYWSSWGSETKTSNDQWTSTSQENTSTSQNYWSGWTSETKETSAVTSDYGSNASQTQWAGWGYDKKDSNDIWTDDTNSASKDTSQNYWDEQTDQESIKPQGNELQATLPSNDVTPSDNQWADWTSTTRHSVDLSEPAIMENLWQKSFGNMWHSVMFLNSRVVIPLQILLDPIKTTKQLLNV